MPKGQRRNSKHETDETHGTDPPLWRRMLRDREAAAFIKRHAKEFPPNSYKEDYQVLKNNPSLANAQVMQIIEHGRPYEDRDLERLAALYTTHPARVISKRLRWPLQLTYSRIQRLRRVALEKFRTLQVDDRVGELEPLGTTTRPFKTLLWRLHDREERVLLVAKDGDFVWVDEAGHAFSEEIQDLLNHSDELSLEVLDVEEE